MPDESLEQLIYLGDQLCLFMEDSSHDLYESANDCLYCTLTKAWKEERAKFTDKDYLQ